MPTSWFVNTRGPRADEDYHWERISGEHPSPGRIIDRGFKGTPLTDLVDEEKPGLLLMYEREAGVVLLITGLIPAGDPVDYRTRRIRAGLLGVGDLDDIGELVDIAAHALHGTLDPVPVSYGTMETGGVTVNADAWADQLALSPAAPPDRTVNARSQLLSDTAVNRVRTAEDLLLRHDQTDLPTNGNKVIVLRTDLLNPDEVRDLDPWRCLSDVTSAPELPSATNSVEGALSFAGEKAVNLGRRLGLLIIGGFAVVATALIVIPLIARSSDPVDVAPSPSPSRSPTLSPAPLPSVTTYPLAGDKSGLKGDGRPAISKTVKPGDEIAAKWTIVNKGSVDWTNRYMTLEDADSTCPDLTVSFDRMPRTPAGGEVTFEVSGKASASGQCTSTWKVTDQAGKPYFPEQGGYVLKLRIQP